jgi:hypothetical protein
LQSIMPAPVFSRSSLTSAAVISAMLRFLSRSCDALKAAAARTPRRIRIIDPGY